MTLVWIILATTVAGVLSIAAAASLSLTILSRMVDKMVSLSVGVLLATALLHSLPEAFTSHDVDIPSLFVALMAGLLGFFILEKAALLDIAITMSMMAMAIISVTMLNLLARAD